MRRVRLIKGSEGWEVLGADIGLAATLKLARSVGKQSLLFKWQAVHLEERQLIPVTAVEAYPSFAYGEKSAATQPKRITPF